MDLEALQQKSTRFGIGLMSGSSCDGIDAALVRLRGTGADLHIKLMDFKTTRYPAGFRTRLLTPRKDVPDIATLDFELGRLFADVALSMVDRAGAQDIEVDFIASHGHTLVHVPPREGSQRFGTVQVGQPAVIAERTGLPVVGDFRPRDMAAGGQGAPLAPYADWVLFHREDRVVACLNLGGIANISVVPQELEEVTGFDTGPCNMVIDGAMRILSRGVQFMDQNGVMAGKGNVVDEFLELLLSHPYFDLEPPKSTGRRDFGPEVYLNDALMTRRTLHPAEDLMATVTTAVARSIVQAFERFIAPSCDVSRLVVGGGGVHNRTLMRLIREGFPEDMVRSSDDYGLPADAREAIAFAILGNETICGTPSNVPRVTGASKPVLLGNITPA